MPDLDDLRIRQFDFVKLEQVLRVQFEHLLDRAVPSLTPLDREKVLTAHDRAICVALVASAPAGSLV